MRKILSIFVVFSLPSFLLVPLISVPAEAKEEATRNYAESFSVNPKIDPYLEVELRRDDGTKLNYFGDKLSVMIEFTGEDAYVLENLQGLEVRSVVGNIVTAFLPEDLLERVASSPFVRFIHADKPMELFLDVSVPDTWGDEMWTKTRSGTEVTGWNVIIGIVDSGIDWTHEDFIDDDNPYNTRIDNIWDQTIEPTDPEALPGEHHPLGYSYGVEVDSNDISVELVDGPPYHDVKVRTRDDSTPTPGHGTHVMSIAAGDGSKSSGLYRGMAPDARIIVVKNVMTAGMESSGQAWESTVIDGINYIAGLAQGYGKTAVINLSLGSHYYAHDGNSPLEQAIDTLSVSPGVIFVVSAGNHADDDIHASGSATAGDPNPVDEEFHIFWATAELEQTIWYDDTLMDVLVTTPPDENGNPQFCGPFSSPTPPGEDIHTCQIQGFWLDWDPWLGNTRLYHDILITMVLRTQTSGPNQILITIQEHLTPMGMLMTGDWFYSLWATTGSGSYRYDSWMTYRNYQPPISGPVYNDPDVQITIAEPATGNSVISVGAYVTKPSDETNDIIQDIAWFSSHGPTRDGREKPEITAPGRDVTAAKSKDVGDPSEYYVSLAGTSMSAPHVAGCVALMRQIEPSLSFANARNLIINSATRDPYTPSSGWSEVWGNGKLSCELSGVSLDGEPPVIDYFRINDDNDYTLYTNVELALSVEPSLLDVYQVRYTNDNTEFYQQVFYSLSSPDEPTEAQATATLSSPLCWRDKCDVNYPQNDRFPPYDWSYAKSPVIGTHKMQVHFDYIRLHTDKMNGYDKLLVYEADQTSSPCDRHSFVEEYSGWDGYPGSGNEWLDHWSAEVPNECVALSGRSGIIDEWLGYKADEVKYWYYPYYKNYYHAWRIEQPGATKIEMHFKKISIGDGDYLTVSSYNDGEVARYTSWGGYDINVAVNDDVMFIKLFTNRDDSRGTGFEIDYYKYLDADWNWLPYTPENTVDYPWQLLPGDGTKTVYCQAMDHAGLVTTCLDTIELETWSVEKHISMLQPPYGGDNSHPRIAVYGSPGQLNSDRIYVVWQNYDPNFTPQYKVFIAESTDGGQTWEAPVWVSSPVSDSKSPDVAISGQNGDYVTIVWSQLDPTEGDWDIYFRILNIKLGHIWEDPIALTYDTEDDVVPKITTGAQYVHVVWQKDTASGYSVIYYIRNDDYGHGTWGEYGPITGLVGYSYDPSIAASDHYVHVVYEDQTYDGSQIVYLRNIDWGSQVAWRPAYPLTHWPPSWFCFSPVVAAVANYVHVAWEEWREDDYSHGDIYFKRSIDHGGNWLEGEQRITTSTGSQEHPDIGARGDTVHLAWEDNRVVPGPPHVFYAKSLTAGAPSEWKRYGDVTRDSDSATRPALVASPEALHVVWSQWDGANYQIYYKRDIPFS